jgi:hypothetical protein
MSLWDVTPHNLGRTCCLHLQGKILKVEAAHPSEELVTFYISPRRQSFLREPDILQLNLINLLDQKH